MTAPALTKMTKIEVVVPGGEAPPYATSFKALALPDTPACQAFRASGTTVTDRVGCSSISKRRWNYSSPLSRNRK